MAAIRIGMLTPSSNTVLESTTWAMLSGLAEVTVHFARFKVTEIALSDEALGQFDDAEILRAAELLAHAKVDVIGWNGTSASWLGFDRDERLCERIEALTGAKACTSVLAFRELFDLHRIRRLGLVTPYTDDVQERIIRNWTAAGVTCTAERHLGLRDNFSFAEVDAARVAEMVREVAREGCEAIAILCTNMRGARMADALEAELGVPVYDSIATTLWKSLKLTGVETSRLQGWGSLFTGRLPARFRNFVEADASVSASRQTRARG